MVPGKAQEALLPHLLWDPQEELNQLLHWGELLHGVFPTTKGVITSKKRQLPKQTSDTNWKTGQDLGCLAFAFE